MSQCGDGAGRRGWCKARAGWQQKAAGRALLHVHSLGFGGHDPVPWVLPPPCKDPSIGSPRSSLPSLPPLVPKPPLFSAPEVVLAGILAESHADIFSRRPPFQSCSLSHPGEGKQPRRDFMTMKYRNPPFFFFSTSVLSPAPLTHPKWVQTWGGGWGHEPSGTALGAGWVARPSGHVLQPFPTRAGACGGHGSGTDPEQMLGLKKKARAIKARLAEEHVGWHWGLSLNLLAAFQEDFPASAVPTQRRSLGTRWVQWRFAGSLHADQRSSLCLTCPLSASAQSSPHGNMSPTFSKATSDVGCRVWVATL